MNDRKLRRIVKGMIEERVGTVTKSDPRQLAMMDLDELTDIAGNYNLIIAFDEHDDVTEIKDQYIRAIIGYEKSGQTFFPDSEE